MLTNILKKLIYININYSLDGRFWLQKALLKKKYKKNLF